MSAVIVAQLFPLTAETAFVMGRLSCLRSIAIALNEARREMGDPEAVEEVADRINLGSAELVTQLAEVGAAAGCCISTEVQAERACRKGQLGVFPAYLAGAFVESMGYLNRAWSARTEHDERAFADEVSDDLRERANLLLEDVADSDIREHDWIPGGTTPASMYVVTSAAGEATLWLSDVGRSALQNVQDLDFTPVPDDELRLAVGA